MGRTISAIVCGALALFALVISVCSFMEKGFPLNNAYIFATQREREQMDKRPFYRQTAVISALIAAVYLCITLVIVLSSKWPLIGVGIFSAAAIVYAVKTSVR